MNAEPAYSALTFAIHGMSDAEKLTALALQGLANRRGPRLYYFADFWNWPAAETRWVEFLTASRGFAFTPFNGTLPELVAHFRADVNGLVVWDPRHEQTRWVAMTLAGLRGLLPVAPECIERYAGLDVVEDLRGRFTDRFEPTRYAVRELLPQCNRSLGYSANATWSGGCIDALDYAVQQQSLVWSLLPGGADARGEELDLVRQIHSKLDPLARIMGWAEPELDYCALATHNNNIVYCAEAPNLSFFAQVPARHEQLRQPARVAEPAWPLQHKHYLAVLASEGDTPKIHAAMHGGAWHDPDRGKIPWNWGAQPLLLRDFPVLLEYFYETATENDYFMGGASGAGFVYPNQLPDPQAYFELVRTSYARADLHDTESWLHYSKPVYEAYARDGNLESIAMPCGPFGVTFTNDGHTPVFLRGNCGLNYFNSQYNPATMSLAEAIRLHCTRRTAPSFTTLLLVPDGGDNPTAQGGYKPGDMLKTQQELGDGYEFVTMQKLSHLARAAHAAGRLPDCLDDDYSEWD